jgi:hypothetical protein
MPLKTGTSVRISLYFTGALEALEVAHCIKIAKLLKGFASIFRVED